MFQMESLERPLPVVKVVVILFFFVSDYGESCKSLGLQRLVAEL